MSFFSKKKICVTHNGTFHSDDLFATAVLSILNNGNIKIVRTRNPEIISTGDYVYDVGGKYDPDKNLFDHHQKGGASARSNGIPYASFGLVWAKYGESLCGSREVAEEIDRKLVQPIDAVDNGMDIVKPIFPGVSFYGADQVFLNNIPTWKEDEKGIDLIFEKQVLKVVELLKREIEVVKSDVEARNIVLDSYNKSEDKRIIFLEKAFPRYLYQKTLSKFPEPLYVIMPSGHSSMWKAEAVSKSPETMESRMPFPETWRGFFDGDPKFREISGEPEAFFCHKSGFLVVANTKDGIISLVEKALIA